MRTTFEQRARQARTANLPPAGDRTASKPTPPAAHIPATIAQQKNAQVSYQARTPHVQPEITPLVTPDASAPTHPAILSNDEAPDRATTLPAILSHDAAPDHAPTDPAILPPNQ